MRISLFFILTLVVIPSSGIGQEQKITVSGAVVDQGTTAPLPFVNVVLKSLPDSTFYTGAVSNEGGLFVLNDVVPGDYIVQASFTGYQTFFQPFYVGTQSAFLDLGTLPLLEKNSQLGEVLVTGKQDAVTAKMDKKTYEVEENISQSGGSAIQVMQNLPGITVQDGKVLLRGNSNVIILIDGKQSALTGFGNQSGLENIPASAIERVEIINNPSSKYDANGSAGIINIILKKESQDGFNGKVGLSGGLGALWIKKENLPDIRPQYQQTPKINPSLSINYRKEKVNFFLQTDYLYKQTLNKNEFVTRTYDDGTIIQQQTKRNRNTGFLTAKTGLDWNWNKNNSITIYGLFGSEDIIDNGDEPFFNADLSERKRLWTFTEDELKTTLVGSASYNHKFKQAGHQLTAGLNYTFHRENEQYYFVNTLPTYVGLDSFKLISDEQVFDFNFDYTKPLKYGKFEVGAKFRNRIIPTNMQFIPGLNSPLDSNAGGWANYKELIPAVYGNYVFQNKKFDAEIGVRIEYVDVNYQVNPNHPTYKSDGYDYIQPFPNLRLGYRINKQNKLSMAFNRRVNRPNEVDIRVFPKYDDAEIIKVGNPQLHAQFTNKAELGYKLSFNQGYFYGALYGQITDGTITRIATTGGDSSTVIYNVFHNAGRSYNAGIELVYNKDISTWLSLNINGNVYYNQIDAFTVVNNYPITESIQMDAQSVYSGNAKLNAIIHFKKDLDVQLTGIYMAPDIIPQGTIGQRFSMDLGIRKSVQKGKGQLFLNATDLFNTMVIRQTIIGDGFQFTSDNYYETQVIRLGYSYRF